jgi:hypothetical protein
MRSIALAVCALFATTSAQAVTIDFEGLPAMTYITGNPIPANARLSDQFVSTLGVRFASGSDYVPVIRLGDFPGNAAPSGVNGIGGSTDSGILTYNDAFPIRISFWDPSNPTVPATTDFVSITGDLIGSIHTVSFDAFDILGNLLDTDGGRDTGGRIYSVAAQLIHEVRFSGVNTPTIGGSGGVGLDDLTFNPVTPVPELSTFLLLGAGLVILGLGGRRTVFPSRRALV